MVYVVAVILKVLLINLHFLCTHFWQLGHCSEFLPTPLLQTPHGHLTAFCLTFWRFHLIITGVNWPLNPLTTPPRNVLFFSRPRSESWPHHGRTFSIHPCFLSFWLTLPRRVLSTSWCCPSRPCVAFLAFEHLALFLALSLSPGNSLVSSWCDHSMLASLLWRCLTVPSSDAFERESFQCEALQR